MNIVIPMAGRGERFSNSGFTVPKPIIDVGGKPMIQAAIESLNLDGNYTFIVYNYELEAFNQHIKDAIHGCVKNPKIISINYTTQGPASSVLLAKELINNDEPLLTANCDQIMNWDGGRFMRDVVISDDGGETRLDGRVVTYWADTNKNSYVKLDAHERAVEFAEKRIISNHSLNGIHFWRKGRYFVDSAEEMMKKNIRVNNEFYIAPTYNELIQKNMKIGIWQLKQGQHHAIGTPEDLQKYMGSL
jgi:NDP-sugar pyrophosphorylase family protein